MYSLPAGGIDHLLKDTLLLRSLSKKNVGFITNQSALTQDFLVGASAVREKIGPALKCILTPEHGWSGFIAEGVEIGDGVDLYLGLPILSLYGPSKKFVEFISANAIDVILIDLTDVGLRCYTYAATCAKFFEACAEIPLEIIVCDRPNPLGPAKGGPLLDPAYRSLLAYLDVPFQHGQTMGGLLSSFNTSLGEKKLPLTVIPCQPYHTPYHYPWIPPSPNLPSWESVLLYPALVLLEGVNVSEGRGTTLPFTSLGAPGLNAYELVAFLNDLPHSGIRARPLTFTPNSGDFKGRECQGVHLILTDPSQLDALSLGTHILRFLKERYADFKWTTPTEGKKDLYIIDALMGTTSFREAITTEGIVK